MGFNYKPPRRAIRQALRSEGGLSADSFRAALAANQKVQQAVTRDFQQTTGQDFNFYMGAAGMGAPTQQQQRALALQQSGLRTSTIGKRLESSFQTAMERVQRQFQGQLAAPSIGPQALQAQRLQQEQEDLPA
jgi:hypothetical protein